MARSLTVPMLALAAFQYDGRDVAAGELVIMRPLDAAAAVRARLVSLTRPARGLQARPAAPAPEPEATPEKRRRYRRRDLQPEP